MRVNFEHTFDNSTFVLQERLAFRKANTITANKAAKKAAKEVADTKRHFKAAKVMKFMEKTRKPRKTESEKTPRTAEEAKEFRAKKTALYKTKAVSVRKAIKGAKKVAAQPKTVTKAAFKARKNLKKAIASKAANLDHIPEEVAARSRARKEVASKKISAMKKVSYAARQANKK